MPFEITKDQRNDLLNPRYTRKERMKRVIEWFLENRQSLPPYSSKEFGLDLSRPLRSYGIAISGQNIWTYRTMRNLPWPDKFKMMIYHIEENMQEEKYSWQYQFAKMVLEILESEDAGD